jgi:hypothetical protein
MSDFSIFSASGAWQVIRAFAFASLNPLEHNRDSWVFWEHAKQTTKLKYFSSFFSKRSGISTAQFWSGFFATEAVHC